MAASLDDLYEQDFYAWTRDQARALRRLKETRPNVAIDLAHLILEVEDLGKSERDAVRSYLRTIIEHCLKLAYSPATEPRTGWMSTIGRTRTALEDKLAPSLRRDHKASLGRLYDQARRDAARDFRLFGEPDAADALPNRCLGRSTRCSRRSGIRQRIGCTVTVTHSGSNRSLTRSLSGGGWKGSQHLKRDASTRSRPCMPPVACPRE